MTRVLITGMSGSGKSTVLAELGHRGYRVVDADDATWAEEVASTDLAGVEQLWREDRMSALLAADHDDDNKFLFVAGCVGNQGKFYESFDAVVLLSAPVDVLLERIRTRTTNGFGKNPAERQRILADLQTVEPLLRAPATAEIKTDRPLAEVVDAVEAVGRAGSLA